MLKKIASFLLCVSLLLTFCNVTVFAESDMVELQEVFKQDFSTYSVGETISTNVNAAADTDGDMYAEIKSNESEVWYTQFPDKYTDGIYTFSFDYMIEEDSVYGFQLQVGGCMNFERYSATADQEHFFTDKAISKYRFKNIAPDGLDHGIWFNVSLAIDITNQIYDVYFDGVKTASGVRFRNTTVNNLEKIYIIPLGTDSTDLRHIKFDNFVLSKGGKTVTTIEESEANLGKMPTVNQFERTIDELKMDDAFAISVGNPYMLMGDTRALYDYLDNSLVPFIENEEVYVPAELVNEVIDSSIPTVSKNEKSYCTINQIVATTGLEVSKYDDMYIISEAANVFTADETEYVQKVKERFPNVLPVTKPTSYDFVTMFNNDMTGTGATSWAEKSALRPTDPYYQRDLLMLQIDEVAEAGVDVQVMAALMGSVQMWKGRNNPFEEHINWMWNDFEQYPTSGIFNYYLRGGDILEDYIDRTHEHSQKAFVSMRINDWHHLSSAWTDSPTMYSISKFYYDNKDKMTFTGNVKTLNWKYPEVREFMLKKIRDLCENYDIDGLELDFLRHHLLFDDTITEQAKFDIMTEFVSEVRKILDNTSIDGKYRYLQARVGHSVDVNKNYGLDLAALANAGIDCFVASSFYNTSCQMDIAGIRTAIGEDKFLAAEITNCIDEIAVVDESGGDNTSFLRATKEQIYTSAYNALSNGADGVYAFNFQYYRAFGSSLDLRGPFNEPPFDVFKNVENIEFLEKQPLHYWLEEYVNPEVRQRLIAGITQSTKLTYNMNIALPADREKNGAKLRFYFEDADKLKNCKFTVTFNGVELEETDDVSLHYITEFNQCHGEAANYKAYIIPEETLVNGNNTYTIKRHYNWNDTYGSNQEAIYVSRSDVLIGITPIVEEVTPAENSENVALDTAPTVKFNTAMDVDTLTPNNIVLKNVTLDEEVLYTPVCTIVDGRTQLTMSDVELDYDCVYKIEVTDAVISSGGAACEVANSSFTTVSNPNYKIFESFEDDEVDTSLSSSNTVSTNGGTWTSNALEWGIVEDANNNNYLEIKNTTSTTPLINTLTLTSALTDVYSVEYKFKMIEDMIANSTMELTIEGTGTQIRFITKKRSDGVAQFYGNNSQPAGLCNSAISDPNEWHTVRMVSTRDGKLSFYVDDELKWEPEWEHSAINKIFIRCSEGGHFAIDDLKIYDGAKPEVTSFTVADGRIPTVVFGTEMDKNSLNSSNVVLTNRGTGETISYTPIVTINNGKTTLELTNAAIEAEASYDLNVKATVKSVIGVNGIPYSTSFSTNSNCLLYENFEDDEVDTTLSTSNTIASVGGTWSQASDVPLSFGIIEEEDGNNYLEFENDSGTTRMNLNLTNTGTGVYSIEFSFKMFENVENGKNMELTINGTGNQNRYFIAKATSTAKIYGGGAFDVGSCDSFIDTPNEWHKLRFVSTRNGKLSVYVDDVLKWEPEWEHSKITGIMFRCGAGGHFGIDNLKIYDEKSVVDMIKSLVYNKTENGVSFSYVAKNATASDITGTHYIAFYNDKRLVYVKPIVFTIPNNLVHTTIEESATTDKQYDKIKIFTWNDSLQPISEISGVIEVR